MAIEFHCEHCGKQIRTGDEHAGKRGKCPACHQSVYIPTPTDEIEPLKLAPVDQGEEKEYQRLMEETRELRHRTLHEREKLPPDSGPPNAPASEEAREPAIDVETLVVEYAMCMADGNLAGADSLARDIRRHMRDAERVMDRLLIDEMPPANLARIPRPVLAAFFKQLREKK